MTVMRAGKLAMVAQVGATVDADPAGDSARPLRLTHQSQAINTAAVTDSDQVAYWLLAQASLALWRRYRVSFQPVPPAITESSSPQVQVTA